MSIASMIFRRAAGRGDKKRDKGLTTPYDVVRFDNILYGKDKKWNRLDVYRPKFMVGELPVIVSIHGGGWVYGSKEVYQFYCMSLAQQGFAVVNFSYRLAPEHRYPAQLRDINRVMRWVMKSDESYGLDKKNIFLVGDSAGAHMASIYSCICTNPDYAAKFPFKTPKGFCPKAVALNCGVYKLDNKEGSNKSLMKDLLGKQYSQEKLEELSPYRHITENFSPAYVMTSTGDFLRDEPTLLMQVFDEKKIPYEYHLYGTEENQLGHVFHCNICLPEAEECNEAECAFFKQYIE
ncbi:MAG: alpha/beta hydrolase [Lachnospiraceae bacterium]